MESNRVKVIFRGRRRISKFCLTLAMTSFLCLVSAATWELSDLGGEQDSVAINATATAREIRIEARSKIIQMVLFVVGAGVLMCSVTGYLVFWRCPYCDGALGVNVQPNCCPRCSGRLDGNNKG